MIYTFLDTPQPASFQNLNPDIPAAGVITREELKRHLSGRSYQKKVRALMGEQDTRFRSDTEIYGDAVFSIISSLDVSDITKNRDRAGILIEKNLFLIVPLVDEDGSIAALVAETVEAVGANPSIERVIACFFERLTARDYGVLEEMASRIDHMEEQVERSETGPGFNGEILSFRRKLTTVRSYYEQLTDFAETLSDNENDLFLEKNLRHFSNMLSRMSRLSGSVQQLRDSLVQVREAYQASLEYKQNQIMKLFTVVTTIFLPLTLLVGWYGMNFHYMPELSWEYGYISVIIASVALVFICLYIFKKKKWM